MKNYLKEESFGKSEIDADINTYGDCFEFVEKYIGHKPKLICVCRESDKTIGFMLDDGAFYGTEFDFNTKFYEYACKRLNNYYSNENGLEGHVVKVVSGTSGEASFVIIPKDEKGEDLLDETFENWQEFGPEMKALESFPEINLSTDLDFDPYIYTYNVKGKHFHYLNNDAIKNDPNEFDKGPLKIRATFDPDAFDENTKIDYNRILNEGIFDKHYKPF